MLTHHTAHGAGWRLLFHDHHEARALWVRIVRAVPALVALCLMPDHLHLLARRDVSPGLRLGMIAYARWRNAHRGERGPVWAPAGPPEEVPPGDKEPRLVRYVHLNPCRAGLVDDPLAWPWSSYRDRLGLGIAPAVPRAADPHDLHRYTSSDPSVQLSGTLLPMARDRVVPGDAGMQELLAAVSELHRLPMRQLAEHKGLARTHLIRAARCTTGPSTADIALHLGMSERAVRRVPAVGDPSVTAVHRVLGDARFPGIPDGDLRRTPELQRYRARRAARSGGPG